MNISNIVCGKKYRILTLNLNDDIKILELYEQGIIEGELITKVSGIKTSKKLNLVDISGQMYALSNSISKYILVEELNE